MPIHAITLLEGRNGREAFALGQVRKKAANICSFGSLLTFRTVFKKFSAHAQSILV